MKLIEGNTRKKKFLIILWEGNHFQVHTSDLIGLCLKS